MRVLAIKQKTDLDYRLILYCTRYCTVRVIIDLIYLRIQLTVYSYISIYS